MKNKTSFKILSMFISVALLFTFLASSFVVFADTTVSALSQIEAESANTLFGSTIAPMPCAAPETGTELGGDNDGNWALYNNVDFGSGMIDVFNARVATVSGGRSIEIHDGSSTGTLLGTLSVAITSGWGYFTNQTCKITPITGIHNICLVFKGGNGVCALNWFTFSAPPILSAYSKIEAENFDTSASITTPTSSDTGGGLCVSANVDSGWTQYYSVDFGSIGAISFSARVATGSGGKHIVVHDGSPTGTILGTLNMVTTGWSTYTTQTCSITLTTGVHDIYLVYTGGTSICLFNWFNFNLIPLTSAFSQIEAESFVAQSGTITTQSTGAPENGIELGAVSNGTWTQYDNIDFGSIGATGFVARLSAVNGGGSIQVRDGSSTGTLLGTLNIQQNANWTIFTAQSCITTPIIGIHNICLVFVGGSSICGLNWINFTAPIPRNPYNKIEAEGCDVQSGSLLILGTGAPENGTELGRVSDGTWAQYISYDFGSIGSTGFEARLAAVNGGGSIQIRDGSSTGTLLGTLNIQRNLAGDWTVFTTQSCTIAPVTGVHNICLLFSGGSSICGLDWFNFMVPAAKNAFNKIEAENYDGQSGTIAQLATGAPENGTEMGSISDGTWLEFVNVNFGSVGSTGFEARLSAINGGGHIDVRDGSTTGTLLGTLNISYNADWTIFTTQGCAFSTPVTGAHNIFLVFRGGGAICGLNWIRFTDPITFDSYNVSMNNVLTNIQPGTTGNQLLASTNVTVATGATYAVTTPNGSQDVNSQVGTGSTIAVSNNGVLYKSYTALIYGDLNGDGNADLADLVLIRESLLGSQTLSGLYAKAGDLYGEGSITLNDLVGLMASISNSGTINQNLS